MGQGSAPDENQREYLTTQNGFRGNDIVYMQATREIRRNIWRSKHLSASHGQDIGSRGRASSSQPSSFIDDCSFVTECAPAPVLA
eukprot:7088781-Pyramimonas_sp.AAC.1